MSEKPCEACGETITIAKPFTDTIQGRLCDRCQIEGLIWAAKLATREQQKERE